MPLLTRRDVLGRVGGVAASLLAARAIGGNTGEPGSVSAAPATPDPAALKKFSASVAGHVISPGDTDYDAARLIFNRAFDRRPALIVRCASADDVARSIGFARSQKLPIAVKGGGHNRAGLSMCDRGLVIDLSGMYQIDVDATRRTASAQAGAMSVQLDAATQKFGLATTSAGCPTVGIAGLTLGGGEGLLMSRYGAACDNLVSANLTLADGSQVVASEHSNPDLFWAIRGGGGNFGVATRLEFRLHPVSQVLAGTIGYAPGRIPELLHAFARFVASAPDEMNVVGQILPGSAGARFALMLCHCGEPGAGNRLIEPLRALGPTQENIRVAPYLEVNATINPAAPVAHFQTNLFLRTLSDQAIAILSAAAAEAPAGTRVFMVPLYGAISRVPPMATAFPLRTAGFELDIMGRWTDAPADAARATAWVTALRDQLRPLASGAYVNQLGEQGPQLARFAYGGHYARLAQIKRRVDPDNLFRSNQNIEPA